MNKAKQTQVKVPVVMQMEALECGAASLSMILAYHGRWLPLAQLREDSGVSRDGVNAKNILVAARSYGLVAKGKRANMQNVRDLPLPCILYWDNCHFVVLRGFTKTAALINDPGQGAVSVPMQEFERCFSGVALTFETGEGFQKGGKPESVLQFAKARLSGTGGIIAYVMVASLLATAVGIVYPAFSRVFLDQILGGANANWLGVFCAALIAVAAVELSVNVARMLFMYRVEGKLAISSNVSFLWHVLRMPMRFFSQRMAGDIMDRQNANQNIAATLIGRFAPIAVQLVSLVFYLMMMLNLSVPLSAIGLSVLVCNMVLARVISNYRVNLTRVMLRDGGQLSGLTASGIQMIETLKASGAEDGFFEQWAGRQAAVNAAQVRATKLNVYLGGLPNLLIKLSGGAVLVLGMVLIMQGQFTAGMLLAFNGFLSAFIGPTQTLIQVGQDVQEMRSNMERVEDVMGYPEDDCFDETEHAQSDEQLSGAVTLKNITFGYAKLAPPLLTDFSLDVQKGMRVALLGSSGSGKSTVAKLIAGLYKPWSGEILFDRHPREHFTRSAFVSSVSVVDQDIVLFEDSVLQNIKLSDASIEDTDMVQAAQDAGIHHTVLRRGKGYEEIITPGGRNWSGGQRQQMEIARALADNPTLLILDEATSALDAGTEQQVMDNIKARGITLILIAHRLSTVRDADLILVLDNGHVVESGTHETLMNAQGAYAKLVSAV